MNNTMQLYIDDNNEVKGYPITTPDRVIDENGVSVKKRLKNNVKFDIVGKGEGIPEIDGKYDDTEIKKQINNINEQMDNITYFVTPEMFGAKGDGSTDDSLAIKKLFESGINTIVFGKGKRYLISNTYYDISNKNIIGNMATILVDIYDGYPEDIIVFKDINIVRDLYVETINNTKAFHVTAFKGCHDSIFDNFNITITDCPQSKNSRPSPMDIVNNNKNIKFNNCNFIHMADAQAGGIWIRENNVNSITDGIEFNNCNFVKKNGDEIIAVWGWKGEVKNIKFNNCKMELLANTTPVYYTVTVGQDGKCSGVEFNNCCFDIEQSRNGIFNTLYNTSTPGINGDVYINNCTFNIKATKDLTSSTICFGGEDNNKHLYTNCIFNCEFTNNSIKTMFKHCIITNCKINNNRFSTLFDTCEVCDNDITSELGQLFSNCNRISNNKVKCKTATNVSVILYSKKIEDSIIIMNNNIKCEGTTSSIFAQIRDNDLGNSFYLSSNIFDGIILYINNASKLIINNDIYNTNGNSRWTTTANIFVSKYIKNNVIV